MQKVTPLISSRVPWVQLTFLSLLGGGMGFVLGVLGGGMGLTLGCCFVLGAGIGFVLRVYSVTTS